jgi:hypothetical protein
MSQTLQILLGIVTLIGAISSFLIWHFNTLHKLKDQLNDLRLEIKDLEKKDDLQQQTLDQLNEFYPLIRSAFEILKSKNV